MRRLSVIATLAATAAAYNLLEDKGCCAEAGDGTYSGKLRILGKCDDDTWLSCGLVGTDVKNKKAMILFDTDTVEESKYGWFSEYCEEEDKYYAVAWNKDRCFDYSIPEEKFPRMCVGTIPGSRYRVEEEVNHVDSQVHLHTFTTSDCDVEKGCSHITVNKNTCAPFLAFAHRKADDSSKGSSSNHLEAEAEQAGSGGGWQDWLSSVGRLVKGKLGSKVNKEQQHYSFRHGGSGGRVGDDEHNFMAVMFVNGTTDISGIKFGYPSRCKPQLKGPCGRE